MKEPTAYELWKSGYKINLRAFTEEEMFNFGFEAGRLHELQGIIEENKLAKKIVKQTKEKK